MNHSLEFNHECTSRVSRLIRLIALLVVGCSPWLFGAIDVRIQVLLAWGIVGCVALWFVDIIWGSGTITLPAASIPIVGALMYGMFQLVPLSPSIYETLSPMGAELRAFLVPDAEGLSPTMSLYPAVTRYRLAALICAFLIFLIGSQFFRSRQYQKWVWFVFAMSGFCLSIFGILQRTQAAGSLIGQKGIAASGVGLPFGPFVNYNNAGGYLNLCIAAAIGLQAVVFRPSVQRQLSEQLSEQLDVPLQNVPARNHRRSLKRAFQETLSGLNASRILWFVVIISLVAGVLICRSRGAFLSMVGAGGLTMAMAQKKRVYALIVFCVLLGGMGLVSWVGLTQQVNSRLATLLDIDPQLSTEGQGRIPNWSDAIDASHDFQPFGSGIGTYRYVYVLYQNRPWTIHYYHAENQYVEALLEAGFIGLGLLLVTMFLVTRSIIRLWKIGDPVAYAGVFALTSQAIHACFDFGLYIPSNTLLCALICGVVVGRDQKMMLMQRHVSGAVSVPVSRLRLCILLVVLSGLGGISVMELMRPAAIHSAFFPSNPFNNRLSLLYSRSAEPLEKKKNTSADIADIEEMRAALSGRWDDAVGHLRFANHLIEACQKEMTEQLRQEKATSAPAGEFDLRTSPSRLHLLAYQLKRSGNHVQLQRLRSDPLVQKYLVPAVVHLRQARRSCPLLAEVHLRLAELCFVTDGPWDDADDLKRAQRVAPTYNEILYQSGLLDLQAGRSSSAWVVWKRCLSLKTSYEKFILAIALQQLSIHEMLEQLFPDDPEFLIRLAKKNYSKPEQLVHRQATLMRAESLISDSELPPATKYFLQGTIHSMQKRWAKAVDAYRKAVDLRSDKIEWHYEFAVALYRDGQLKEADQQAKWCRWRAPKNRQYRQLEKKIVHDLVRPPSP